VCACVSEKEKVCVLEIDRHGSWFAACCSEIWCCSMLQASAVAGSRELQYDAVCCRVLQFDGHTRVAVGCSVVHTRGLQCDAVCCSVLQRGEYTSVAVCCSVLQCAAVCCSVLQCGRHK